MSGGVDLLSLSELEAGYGEARVLHGINLRIEAGEVVALLGRNGMGKTTTIRAVMGILRPRVGNVTFKSASITGRTPDHIARLGIGLVPEGRRIFPNLTVRENLVATARRSPSGEVWTTKKVLEIFPQLEHRLRNFGTQLSGGEQQMLAIGRALMTNPSLLLLDEATEGLAPLIRAEIWRCLRLLKESGLSILVIDKNIGALTKLADRIYVIEKGRIVWDGSAADFLATPAVIHRYLGV